MIKTLSQLMKLSNELIVFNKLHYMDNNMHKLKNISFLLENYYKNNDYDWYLYNQNKNNKLQLSSKQYIKNKYIYYYNYDMKNNKIENQLELNFISWGPYSKIPLHNHKNKSTIMMPLVGNITQELHTNTNKVFKHIIKEGNISYIDDNIGNHELINNNNNNSLSMHITNNNDINEDIKNIINNMTIDKELLLINDTSNYSPYIYNLLLNKLPELIKHSNDTNTMK